MTDMNDQARDYLNHYLSYSTPPKFAVMIAGEWGCGKTWFIKSLLTELRTKNRNLVATYVSVAGMRETSQVDEALFHELYPALDDPKIRLLGKVASGLIRTTMSIDLEKEFGSESSTGKAMRSSKLDTDLHSNIIVFDDFERCQIDSVELLGYVNRFVETLGCKVILICNEDKVVDTSRSLETGTPVPQYADVKEKVVGSTLKVRSEIATAVKTFINELPSSKAKDALNNNDHDLKVIFNQDGKSNLRALRHSIYDFGRFTKVLDDRYLEHPDLMRDLVEEFFGLSLSVFTRKLHKGDIDKLTQIPLIYSSLALKEGNSDPEEYEVRLKAFADSHSHLVLNRTLIPLKVWSKYFDGGWIASEDINSALGASQYFANSETPLWRRAVDILFTSDEDAKDLVNECLEFLKGSEARSMGECLHVSGALLFASGAGLIRKSEAGVSAMAKRYIDRVYKAGELLETASISPDIVEEKASFGYQYQKHDSPHLIGIYEHYREKVGLAQEGKDREFAKSLPMAIKDSYEKAAWSISEVSGHQGEYAERPLLHHIPTEDMMSALFCLTTYDRCRFMSILDRRYKNTFYLKDLYKEADWLRMLANEMEKYSKANKGTISAYHANNHAEGLRSMAARVDNAYNDYLALSGES
jgi:hypothetical protein|tara:strand:+ start:1105 stop:3030 length:1926 start_codon:yes stop_codon:yes gene_type:complete